MIIRADLVMGSQGDTYDKQEVKASKAFNDLIIGTKVDAPPSKENASSQFAYLQYLRHQAFRAMAANSLDTIRHLRMPAGDKQNSPSQMQLMQSFVDDRYGTPTGDKWLENITNTQKDKKNDFVSDSQVRRSMAQMQAFQEYLEMKMYQSSIRQEQMLAAILTLKTQQVMGN